MKPLHAPEALAALAEGPESPAQSWAASRVAIQAPEQFAHFPLGDDTFDEVLAAGPPRLVELLIERLRSARPCPVGLAASASALGVFGCLPEDPSDLAAALHGAMAGDGSEADLWLAYALATIGPVQRDVLAKASKVAGPDRRWLLPALVLRTADDASLDEAAAEVAAALLDSPSTDHLYTVLATLGVPTGQPMSHIKTVAEAVAQGARSADGEAPELSYRQGSRKRRIQGAVHDLLADVPGPAAALLRAMYRDDADLRYGFTPVAIAAWMAVFEPGDPLHDVRDRAGGADPHRLSSARRTIGLGHRAELLAAVRAKVDPAVGVLAMPLVPGDPEMASAVVDMLVGRTGSDVRVDALACAAAWHCADRIPDLLEHRPTRDLGLLMAEWAPTEEVLTALLALPVPADLDPRMQYARALAAMGDPAVLPTLATLIEQDEAGSFDDARRLAESILHRPVA